MSIHHLKQLAFHDRHGKLRTSTLRIELEPNIDSHSAQPKIRLLWSVHTNDFRDLEFKSDWLILEPAIAEPENYEVTPTQESKNR